MGRRTAKDAIAKKLLFYWLLVSTISPGAIQVAEAAESGRVEKDAAASTKRIARPIIRDGVQAPLLSTGTKSVLLQGTTQQFLLDAADASQPVDGSEQLSNWNPWLELRSRQTIVDKPGDQWAELRNQASSTPQATIDYTEIEKAYEDLLPPAAIQARARNAREQTPMSPLLVPSAAGAMPASMIQAYADAHHAPAVGLDTCTCQTIIPTSQCMQGRTIGLYSNGGSAGSSAFTTPRFGNARTMQGNFAVPAGRAFNSYRAIGR